MASVKYTAGCSHRRDRVAVAISDPDDASSGTEMKHLVKRSNSRFFFFGGSGNCLPQQSITKAVNEKNSTELNRLIEQMIGDDICKEINDNLLLHKAIHLKCPEVMQILLRKVDDTTLFKKDSRHKSALHCAVEEKDVQCFEAIVLKNKLSLVEKDNLEKTPLHYIVKHNFLEGYEKVRNHVEPSFINLRNQKSFTAVHVAAKTHNREEILKLLLDDGGRADAKTNSKFTPLHFAAYNGFKEYARLLLNSIDNTKKKEYLDMQTKENATALMLAAKRGYTKTCYLFEGTDVNLQDKNKNSAMHYAASKGYLYIIEHLISKGANANLQNINKKTALYSAASGDNEKCLTYMLDKVNITHESPQDLLKVAVMNNNTKSLKVLLADKRIRSFINHQFPESNNNTLLHLSISKGFYKVTELLLENGADKNIANDLKEYPLHLAALQKTRHSRFEEKERLEVCKIIMAHSDDLVNADNSKSETPLHLAAKSGNIDMVRSFLKKNSEVLSLDNCERTTIHVAAEYGNQTCLKKLLKELKGNQKKKLIEMMPHPLHLAAKSGHLPCCETIVEILKEDSLTALFRDDSGEKFPVDVAYEEKQPHVFKYLLGKMTFEEQRDKFCARLHGYCKNSIVEEDREILECIIESSWCTVAFDGYYCANLRQPVTNHEHFTEYKPCDSFANLVAKFPEWACKAMDQHVTPVQRGTGYTYNYAPLEFIYYNAADGHVDPPFCSSPAVSDPRDVMHGVVHSAEEFDDVSWGHDHPLLMASTVRHTEVLTHTLTKSWINQKTYAWRLLYLYVLLEIFTAICSTAMFSFMWTEQLLIEYYEGAIMKEIMEVYENIQGYTHQNKTTAIENANCSSFFRKTSQPFDAKIDLDSSSELLVWRRSLCFIEHLESQQMAAWIFRLLSALCFLILIVLQIAFFIRLNKIVKTGTDLSNGTDHSPDGPLSPVHSEHCSKNTNEDRQNIASRHRNSNKIVKTGTDCSNGTGHSPDGPLSPVHSEHGSQKTKEDRQNIVSRHRNFKKIVKKFQRWTRFLKQACLSLLLGNITEFLRLLCLFIVLLPYSTNDYMFGFKEDFSWQAGVIAVLLSWLCLVGTLNKVPHLRVFMPVTMKFTLNYLKLLLHISLIILGFALSFHFLLGYKKAFSNLGYSLIKTLVWMLGDLGYDGMFLQQDSLPPYPVQSNILFVVFVTIIGALVFNILIHKPDEVLEHIRTLATFQQAENSLKVFLFIDSCVPFWRRSYARVKQELAEIKIVRRQSDVTKLSADNSNVQRNEEDNISDSQNLTRQNEILKEKLNNLQEDIQELSKKMIKFINTFPERASADATI